jgi:hypothetical protein
MDRVQLLDPYPPDACYTEARSFTVYRQVLPAQIGELSTKPRQPATYPYRYLY